MKRHRRIIVVVTALATVAVTIQASGAGGQSATGGAIESVQTTARDLTSYKSCDAPFQSYDLGPQLGGYSLENRDATCSAPEPVRSQAAGGGIDPDSLMRVHYRSSIYGTCKVTSDTGCAPPLEVQVWPACERSPADYTFGEPGHESTLKPTEIATVRGVPARFYREGRVELSTGDVTVVIFGNSRELVLSAAQGLRSEGGAPNRVSADQALPAPVRGAQEGTLPCS